MRRPRLALHLPILIALVAAIAVVGAGAVLVKLSILYIPTAPAVQAAAPGYPDAGRPAPIAPSSALPESSASPTPTATPIDTPTPSQTPTLVPTATATFQPVTAKTVTNVPILMYHYIRELPPNTPDQLGYGLSINPKLFDAQLAYLAANGYHSISMAELSAHMTHGAGLPPKPVVLSFDDGYADFYTAALPLLERYHFSATTYIVTDFIGRPGYMSWQQLVDLRDRGFEIGAHTLDHVDLAIQPLPAATRQIVDSRTILQQRLGLPIDTFAYPSGRYNANVLRIVAQAGFSSAVTTNFGDRYTTAQALTLPRVRVPGGISMPGFIANLRA